MADWGGLEGREDGTLMVRCVKVLLQLESYKRQVLASTGLSVTHVVVVGRARDGTHETAI